MKKLHTLLIGINAYKGCTPDGQKVISLVNESEVKVWDIQSGKCLKVLEDASED